MKENVNSWDELCKVDYDVTCNLRSKKLNLQFEGTNFASTFSHRPEKTSRKPIRNLNLHGEKKLRKIYNVFILTLKTINFRQRNIARDKKDFKNCINVENASAVIKSPEVKFTGGMFNAFSRESSVKEKTEEFCRML